MLMRIRQCKEPSLRKRAASSARLLLSGMAAARRQVWQSARSLLRTLAVGLRRSGLHRVAPHLLQSMLTKGSPIVFVREVAGQYQRDGRHDMAVRLFGFVLAQNPTDRASQIEY